MHRLIAAALALALSGCVAPQGLRAPVRDQARMISSSTAYDPAHFGGLWHVVAAFGSESSCGILTQSWLSVPGGFDVTGEDCARRGAIAMNARARVVGPGRLSLSGPTMAGDLWILWVDADYRIAVAGSPAGHFGRVMSREKMPRADLMAAARQVLAFNGYDISQLIELR